MAGATRGGTDSLNKYLQELKTSRNDEFRVKSAKNLRSFVEAEAREMPGEGFAKFMDLLHKRIFELVNSADTYEKIGGIMAIDELIDVDCEENANNIARFANYLRNILPNSDEKTVLYAAKALGHLARTGGALTTDFVEFEVKRALEWLPAADKAYEPRRYAAVLVLRELAENAPTLFYVHVTAFFEHIWVAFRDSKLHIREAAAESLRACLALVGKRESRLRVNWYLRTWDETLKGFRASNPDHAHGSLLVLGELVRNAGDFMVCRFQDACDAVLRYRDHKDRLLRRTVVPLLPRLASFCPEPFVRYYLNTSVQHLLALIRAAGPERGPAYIALGEIATAVGESIEPHLDAIVGLVKEGITVRRGRPFCVEGLTCVSLLARARIASLERYMRELLDQMFGAGLSATLVQALADLTQCIPALLSEIQHRLLDALSAILCGQPYRHPGTPAYCIRPLPPSAYALLSQDAATVTLALQTLGSFDFSGHALSDFVRECVVAYLDDENAGVRRQAAHTCCKLLVPAGQAAPKRGHLANVIGDVLDRLLVVAVADPEASIRLSVLQALDSRFDTHLAQAECLRSLFIALNDELFDIREVAIDIIGRLTSRNPAYVMPSLRKTLIQLLTELEYSGDVRNKEESARLLGLIVRAFQKLVKPYIGPILKVLVSKVHDGSAGVACSVLATLGEVAAVGGQDMVTFMDDLLPLIIDALQDQASAAKREIALRTLANLVRSTGNVTAPYQKFPQLLTIVLGCFKGEHVWGIRQEAMQVLGILGALDPFKHKQMLLMQQGRGNASERAMLTSAAAAAAAAGEAAAAAAAGTSELQGGIGPSCDEYYPTVAITALMKILKDPSLSMQHSMVVSAVMVIFKSVGLKCVPFLPQIVPPFLAVIRSCEPGLRDFMFQQLAVLVSIVKQHIRNYLPDLFALVQEYWHHSALLIQIITLVEEIALAMNDEFKQYLVELLTQMLSILHTDRSDKRLATFKVLHALETFGRNLDEHTHLVVPPVVRLFDSAEAPPAVRQAAVRLIAKLSAAVNFSDFASRIVHPLARLIDGPSIDLRREALDCICALVPQLGPEFLLFAPTVSKALHRQRVHHAKFDAVMQAIARGEAIPTESQGQEGDAKPAEQPGGEEQPRAEMGAGWAKLKVNQAYLKKAWETSQRSTREDWWEWMRRFSVELLRESPSPALRACSALAQVYHPLARELFNASFVSCWSELYDTYQDSLVRSMETAFASESVPVEILQTLLALAEFMEHDEKPLPIDIRTLGVLAQKCHAYAKALHYKEAEFATNPSGTVEALISINNQLQQPEAAVGILTYAQQSHAMPIKELWYEKLQRWDDALDAYEKRLLAATNPAPPPPEPEQQRGRGSATGSPAPQASAAAASASGSASASAAPPPQTPQGPELSPAEELREINLGRMRCLNALGEWERLSDVVREVWSGGDAEFRRQLGPLAANAAWGLSQWDELAEYVEGIDAGSVEGSFFRAIQAVHREQYDEAKHFVEAARQRLDPDLTALVGESYAQAYQTVVRVQQLAELEEVVAYRRAIQSGDAAARRLLSDMWRDRLAGCQRAVGVYLQLLPVRALVVEPASDVDTYLRFASLCRKSGPAHLHLSHTVLTKTLAPAASEPRVSFAYIKHLWAVGKQQDAFYRLTRFVSAVGASSAGVAVANAGEGVPGPSNPTGSAAAPVANHELLAKCYLKLGEWRKAMQEGRALDDETIREMMQSYRRATEFGERWYKAWHAWALNNALVVSHFEKVGADAERVTDHLVAAVSGFVRSIGLGRGEQLQDVLRLLTLWFKYGHQPRVEHALTHGFQTLPIDTWLAVIPQIIARIHTPCVPVRRLIADVLVKVGRQHPQALVYSLTVASKSQSASRRAAAVSVMNAMRQHSPALVEQALLVSQELIRVAILWHEMWHEGLEEASRLYFGDHNVEAMLQTLAPLHHLMDKGPETMREMSFQQAFGRDLIEALDWCKKYMRNGKDSDLAQAWDLYYHVFRRINKQLPQLTTLDLQLVSPKLFASRNLELAVPGTYRANEPVVCIRAFAPQLSVISSKQRPRKLTVQGSDGQDYVFLLKGHEDLRQDERVMQLFGLVNTLLSNDRETCRRDLTIQRYAVVPLSPNSGLIGWVPNCDTLHSLIRDFREARKVMINVEHRLMLQMAPDYDNLTLIQKVEVFEFALKNTRGQDLNQVLWLKSRNAEVWLDRRTNYTRSLAVMSMVGYILGLGDRHPSNLMLHRHTGKILHIDFGDCFEVAMHREKFPERIPFRLTRMLVNAMEVSGIEGNFRLISESVLRVLRENKDSVMAMLEAFVHDPLINWRLLSTNSPRATTAAGGQKKPGVKLENGVIELANPASLSLSRSRHQRGDRERDFMQAFGPEGAGAPPEVLNERAVSVIRRVSNKLTGRDFGTGAVTLAVPTQVDKLIQQATSHENLCQCYIGWCPFW